MHQFERSPPLFAVSQKIPPPFFWKNFHDLLFPMKNETWDASLFFSSVFFSDRRRMVEGGNRTFRSLSLLLLL